MKKRFKASLNVVLWHVALNVAIASLLAVIIFNYWYPYPYSKLAGGVHLFLILISIDLVCGPLLTAIVFNPEKSRREIIFDLSFVGLIQLGAMAYGMHSIALARPVIIAFEVDRFVAVSESEIDKNELEKNSIYLSWTGPELVGLKSNKDGNEMLESLDLSLKGISPSARPARWQSYENSRNEVIKRMKKVDEIYANLDFTKKSLINKIVENKNLGVHEMNYLPLVGRSSLEDWVVVLDKKANIVDFAPLNGFQ